MSITPDKIMKNEELINLKGGYDGGSGGSCGWLPPDGMGIMCGYSKEDVKGWVEDFGGRWCCDTATWYCDKCG
ncbi:MAG: hypothetical protein ACLFQA_03710 [Bacteroidales bacterium]